MGFPLTLLLAWLYDITPDGISPAKPQEGLEPSIAVMPFRAMGAESEQDPLAEALSNDIVTGLTRANNLVVMSPGATRELPESASKQDLNSLAEIGKKLGVNYLLHGSVQKSGASLRVNAALVGTQKGVTLWSQNYDRNLDADSIFAVQDAIQQQIVGAISSRHGVINRSLSTDSGRRPTNNLDAYELFARALNYDRYISEENHLMAREALEKAVELDPDFAEAWAHLSWIYTDEVCWGFNPLPDSMERALEAALKGVRLGQDNHHNHWLLARVYYFMGKQDAFEVEAERSLELNSNDGTTLGLLGLYVSWSGDWERGLAMLQRSKELNPNYPDYYHLVTGSAQLAAGDAQQALKELLRANLPDWPPFQVFLIATYAALDRMDEAREHLAIYRKIIPGVTLEQARNETALAFPFQPSMVDLLVDGLRKAGLT